MALQCSGVMSRSQRVDQAELGVPVRVNLVGRQSEAYGSSRIAVTDGLGLRDKLPSSRKPLLFLRKLLPASARLVAGRTLTPAATSATTSRKVRIVVARCRRRRSRRTLACKNSRAVLPRLTRSVTSTRSRRSQNGQDRRVGPAQFGRCRLAWLSSRLEVGSGVGEGGGDLATLPEPVGWAVPLSPVGGGHFDGASGAQRRRRSPDGFRQRWPGGEEGLVGDSEDDVTVLGVGGE